MDRTYDIAGRQRLLSFWMMRQFDALDAFRIATIWTSQILGLSLLFKR